MGHKDIKMKKIDLRKFLFMGLVGFSFLNTAQAKTPLWTFQTDPAHPPHVNIYPSGNVTIQYKVTNQSSKTHTLRMKSIDGITSSGCTAPLGYHQSCTLILKVSGSSLHGDISRGPQLCQANPDGIPNPNQCYRPSEPDNLAIHFLNQPAPILTPSMTLLALSTNCQPLSSCTATQNAALTGNPRLITVKNTGPVSANNVLVSSSGLPLGTSITSTTCTGTLLAGDSCTITLTPGNVASSDASNTPCTSGTQPLPGVVMITADGGLSTQADALVLGYGCQYQGGFLFAVDDTTVNTGSIGGKVMSLVDQAKPWLPPFTSPGPGVPWDADPACATAPLFQCTNATGAWDFNFGQNLSSVTGSTNPNNTGTNGPGNTWQISKVLNGHLGNTNIAPATYAAGVCISYSHAGFSDWYLPAVCETDSVNGTVFTNCSSTMQSIVGSLPFLIGSEASSTPSTSCNPPTGANCLTGGYWTSTEQTNPGSLLFAWQESFDTITTNPLGNSKEFRFGVRCIRVLS